MLQNFTKPQFNTKFDQNKAKSILGKVNREQNVASDFTLQGTYPVGVPFRLEGFVT